jgi:hypothetical protein
LDHGEVEIDEVAVVGGCASGTVDSMGIMAHRAWRSLVLNVSLVFPKRAPILIENDTAVMALVAKSIGSEAFGSVVSCLVVSLQEVRIVRTVGPIWSLTPSAATVIVAVAIGAVDNTVRGIWRQQARNITIDSSTLNRVIGGIGKIEFPTSIELGNLPWDARVAHHIEVRVTFETDFVFVCDPWQIGTARAHSRDRT